MQIALNFVSAIKRGYVRRKKIRLVKFLSNIALASSSCQGLKVSFSPTFLRATNTVIIIIQILYYNIKSSGKI